MSRPVKVRTILASSGMWPRRALRRLKGGVQTPSGMVPVDASIPLGHDWIELSARGVVLRARQTWPPSFVLSKPTGCVTSRRSSDGSAIVYDYLEDPLAHACEPVGRLDKDTTGTLLFTADGQLLHRLTHPKFEVVRTYRAVLERALDAGAEQQLLAGEVTLDDGHVPVPSRIDREDGDGTVVVVDLSSGKYHEVRRMFAAVGCPVLELHRRSYAGIEVDDLEVGDARRLEGAELERLYAIVGLEPVADFVEVDASDAEYVDDDGEGSSDDDG